MRRVLVTGANGFVGSALCSEFNDNGIDVVAVVRDASADRLRVDNTAHMEVVRCELSDILNLANIVKHRDIDIFYHFAWEGTSGVLRGDSDIQINNIRYACNAVRACAAIDCKRFVYASSIMEYEVANIMRLELAPGINTVYSTAKLAADYMTRTVAADLGIEHICGMISNIYGPGETSPRLINSSLRKLINGEHCSFTDGKQMYDFIYIDDAVRALRMIGTKGEANRSYYIGNSAPRPLREFLCEMRDVVNPDLEIGLGEVEPAQCSLSYREFDMGRLRNCMGFAPEISFKEGIKRTIESIREE